jgi:hypothetical protein
MIMQYSRRKLLWLSVTAIDWGIRVGTGAPPCRPDLGQTLAVRLRRLPTGHHAATAEGEDRVAPCCQVRAARRRAGGSGRGVLPRDKIR